MQEKLRALDKAIYRAEQFAAGVLFLVMSLVMFTSVVHRVFSRDEGRLSGVVLGLLTRFGVAADPAFIHGPVSAALNIALTFGFVFLGVRTMKLDKRVPTSRALIISALVTFAIASIVKGLLEAAPNGLVWGPVVSLCCMLWVGFLGASLATYERGHLALEMGDKLWPKSLAPHIKRLSLFVTALFCVFLWVLAAYSISDHHRSWSVNPLAGALMPTSIPKWVVFLIFPYAFTIMTLRFLGAMTKPEAEAADSHGIPSSLMGPEEQS